MDTLIHAGLWMADRIRLSDRLPQLYQSVYVLMLQLHGQLKAAEETRMFFAKLFVGESIVLFLFLCLSVATGGDAGIALLGLVFIIIFPVLSIREVERKIRTKKQQILMELPLLLNQLVLLINAGETVQQALQRIVNSPGTERKGPLYDEIRIVVEKIRNRVSLSEALDQLNRNCGIQEVSIFVNVLVLNYRRGGGQLVSALHGMSHQMWEARKNTAKTMGEEASAKLVFPMVVIFLVVLIVVSTPAILWMK